MQIARSVHAAWRGGGDTWGGAAPGARIERGRWCASGKRCIRPAFGRRPAAPGTACGRRRAVAGHGLSWTVTSGCQGPRVAIVAPIVARLWQGASASHNRVSFGGGAGGVSAGTGYIRGTPQKFPARISPAQKWPRAAVFRGYLDNGRSDSRVAV